jgi:peptidoglycan/LPS O-acetylase OafA/YrhL
LQIDDNAKGRIPSLDGLRAISILMVLAGHAIQGKHSFGFRLLLIHPALGVRVFFVISGYLITSLLLRERSESGRISLRLFYARRTLRILPAFCLFAGTVAILCALGVIRVPSQTWAYVLTYTVNFDQQLPWVLGHLWSLSVEEQFYLLWPLAMKFARPAVWPWVALLSVVAGILIRMVYTLTGMTLVNANLHYAFPFVCGPIAMGCLLAIYAPTVRRYITGSKFLSGDLVLVLAAPVVLLLDTLDLGTANRFIALVMDSLMTFCIARVVFVPTTMVAGVLNRKPLVMLGKLSYSLYLFQQLFLDSMDVAPILIPFPFNLAAAFAAALVCYRFVEVPFLKLRGRFRQASGVAEVPVSAVAGQ